MAQIKRSDTKEKKKSWIAGLIIGLVLASVVVVSSPVQADEVTDRCQGRIDHGGHLTPKTHKRSCEFECSEGDYIVVEVVNHGGRGRVSIVGECEGARTECVDKVRSCEKMGTFLSQKSGTGECRFQLEHHWGADKVFRCTAISTRGEWEDPPTYAACVFHTLDAWILGGTVGGGVVEVCYYEGNVVCVELIGTFELPDPVPWVIVCGEDLDDLVSDEHCGPARPLGDSVERCLGTVD